MMQPPIYTDLGDAPSGVCSRWMDGSPCGAVATHHVIWNLDMENGAICDTHTAEIREHWVYLGLHPYTPACVPPGEWDVSEDRCVRPGTELPTSVAASAGTSNATPESLEVPGQPSAAFGT